MLQQLKMADAIAKWQMEWPLQDGDWQMLLPEGQMLLPWSIIII